MLKVFGPVHESIKKLIVTSVVVTVDTVAATALVDPSNSANGIALDVLATQNAEN